MRSSSRSRHELDAVADPGVNMFFANRKVLVFHMYIANTLLPLGSVVRSPFVPVCQWCSHVSRARFWSSFLKVHRPFNGVTLALLISTRLQLLWEHSHIHNLVSSESKRSLVGAHMRDLHMVVVLFS